MGRQAASAKDSSGGLGSRFRFGTATCSAIVPWCSSENSERLGSSVSSPVQPGLATTPWTTTSLPSSSIPAASVPRIIGIRSCGSPTPCRLNRSWWLSEAALTWTVVQPSGASGSGPVTDLEDGQRVLRGGRGDEGSEHDRTLTEPAIPGDAGRRRCARVAGDGPTGTPSPPTSTTRPITACATPPSGRPGRTSLPLMPAGPRDVDLGCGTGSCRCPRGGRADVAGLDSRDARRRAAERGRRRAHAGTRRPPFGPDRRRRPVPARAVGARTGTPSWRAGCACSGRAATGARGGRLGHRAGLRG